MVFKKLFILPLFKNFSANTSENWKPSLNSINISRDDNFEFIRCEGW